MRKILLAGIILFGFSGCSADISQYGTYGKDFKVNLYSGGKIVRTWTSNGKVLTETHSDGWYFQDKTSSRLVRVSGNVTVEEL